MAKMSRSRFLKRSLKAGAGIVIGSISSTALSEKKNVDRLKNDSDLFERMVIANDKYVKILVQSNRQGTGRRLGHDFASISAAYAVPQSAYYHNQQVVPQLESLVKALMSYQAPDGTLNLGNLESPPDTGFLLETVTAGAYILLKDNSSALQPVNSDVKKFIVKAADALAVGGVHT